MHCVAVTAATELHGVAVTAATELHGVAVPICNHRTAWCSCTYLGAAPNICALYSCSYINNTAAIPL